jgi:hypothetical protein
LKNKTSPNRNLLIGILLGILAIILIVIGAWAIFKPNTGESQEPTTDPNLVLTAAMQTAESMRLATASAVPPTATVMEATLTPTQTITPTVTLTPTLGPTAPAGGLRVVFGSDVTVPDGTVFAPNTFFTKTWRIINGGTVAWTPAFSLVYQSGNQLGAPNSVPITADVAPGGSIDISVNMVAPAEPGRYFSNWMMRDPHGTLFGLDPEAKFPIYVDITVSASGTALATVTPTLGTPVATVTGTPPTPSPTVSSLFSNVNLSVDNSAATTCPNSFTFTATFTLSKASGVTYALEAGSSNPNYIINLPPQVTTNLEAGQHTLLYTLDFTDSIEAWAQFHISAPENVISNKVNFSLSCSQ